MTKPYHLMTTAEKIAARIASNKEIDEKVARGQANTVANTEVVKNFSRIGHAFLESLPDMDKGTEAAGLLKMGRMAKNRKK